MKPDLSRPARLTILAGLAILASCTTAPRTTDGDPPLSIESSRVTHTTQTSKTRICGALFDYVVDVHRLSLEQQAELLDQLETDNEQQFFCDTIKTGILLSQIGRTIEEDEEAIRILDKYDSSIQLNNGERWLLQLLKRQSEERRRLHVLLNELGDQLITQKSLTRNLSSDLLTLRQQLDQLQKIEADINETQQSIAEPAATIDQSTTQNPDS